MAHAGRQYGINLTDAEMLREEANVARDEKAQKAWETSEGSDTELVEAGVEKLGDLVAEGHFSEKDGSGDFPQAPSRAAPNTSSPSRQESE